MSLSDIALALVVLLAYTTQAVSGFGATVITVTLAALWLPIPFVLPISIMLNAPFSGLLLWQERRHVQWRVLAREVMPLMLLGTAIGAALVPLLAASGTMKHVYGALIVALSILDLWRLKRRPHHRFAAPTRVTMTLGAGVAQGLYASGGPLLAAAMAGSGMNKAASRATMITVWFTINSVLTIWFFIEGRYTPEVQASAIWLFPLTFVGLWIGNRLHHRIDERQYRLLIDVLLLIAGAGLLLR